MKKLILIDAYALIFRYYYAFIHRPMRNSAGLNTSVIFGFTKSIRDLLQSEKPDLLGVAFDPKGGCFRKEIFPEYKANRSATPEDILLSVPYIKRILEAMCIPILEVAGYEADDVIGTLSKKGDDAGYEVFMVTPDKDYGQLVSDNCKMYKQKDGAVEIIGKAEICEKYGIDDPTLVRDILAIWGDSADNIPGVAGIGEKGACKLVQQWGTVENIIANAANIKGKQGEKIAAAAESLPLSKTLTTICLDVPIELDPEALTICEGDRAALNEIFRELNFKMFITDDVPTVAKATAPAPAPAMPIQGDLFAAPLPTTAPEVQPAVEEAEAIEDIKTAENTEHNYHTINTLEELNELVARLMKLDEICFDTETTGLNLSRDEIVGISLAAEPHEAWYIPIYNRERAAIIEALRPLFEAEHIAKIGQNIKFDLMVLHYQGIELRGRLIDTMLLHYLIDPESRHGMNALAERYLNYQPIEIEAIIGRGAKQLSMSQVPIKQITEYAAEDADITLQLKQVLMPMVDGELLELYNSVEEPLIRVLAQMEIEGVTIDVDMLNNYSVVLGGKADRLVAEIREIADEPTLNINSSKQLGEVLFGKMKIVEKPKLTKTKQYSTDEEYLQSLSAGNPIIEKILECRGIRKLLSTYTLALPELVDPVTGKIHTSYNQAVTATGRLSSTNPNLQNIPIRDSISRPIREAFVPSAADRVLLSADYSQVELRLMAHLSGDESLIEAFANGEDIHTATAAKLYHKELKDVSQEERRKAKTANFGIIYGISAFGLSQRLEIPRKEAAEIIEGYFSSYPKVAEYMEQVKEDARSRGYVATLYGRRRYLKDINSRNAVARALAERNAINAPIQGSGADIMKLAMIAIARRLQADGLQSRMIMQVHDEVVLDTLHSELEAVKSLVIEEMERAAQLSVRLVVECGVGADWYDAH